MIRTYLFDFDGTIADTLPLVIELWNRWGLQKIEPEHVEELRSKDVKELLRLSGISRWKLPSYIRKGRKELGSTIDQVGIVPGMKDVLRALHERGTVGIVTTNAEENVRRFLEAHRITELIDFIQSEPAMFGKARRLKRVMRSCGFDPSETVYIGDELRDVDAAKKAGIRIAAVTWGFNTGKALAGRNPDWLIERPDALLSL